MNIHPMHRLQVTIYGSDEHTVVFSHGFGTTQHAWDPRIERLKERCRAVTFNHAGGMEQEVADPFDWMTKNCF